MEEADHQGGGNNLQFVMFNQIKSDLEDLANPEKAKILQRFFKTGKGEYGEGDVFLGITVPEQRKVARKYKELGLVEVKKLLKSGIHEFRLTALLILVFQYEKGDEAAQEKVVDFYLSNTEGINNWDLVDLSAPKILGEHILKGNRKIIYKLVKSKDLWERRIAMLATFTLIKNQEYTDALKIAEELVNDEHDLIHKAVGWMLREIGKRDQAIEEKFLEKHHKTMPRTMLRYAIERFSDEKRKFFM